MAKEGTKLKPSMQIEWYCPAVHKNACKRTLEYTGVKKQITDSIFFFLSFFLSFPSGKYKGFRDDLSYSTSQKSKETRGNAVPSLSHIPSLNSTFFTWHGTEAGYWHFPCFFPFWRGGVWQFIPKSFFFIFGEYFFTVLYEIKTWSRVLINIIQAALNPFPDELFFCGGHF